MFSCFFICCVFFVFHPFKALWNRDFKSALQTNFIIIIIIFIIRVVETEMSEIKLRHFLAAQVKKVSDIKTIRSDLCSVISACRWMNYQSGLTPRKETTGQSVISLVFWARINHLRATKLYVPTAPSDTIPQCLSPSSSDNVHTQSSESAFTSVTGYNMELTPAPQSPHRCCPWSWTGCWRGCRTKTTWPGGGSAGSEANAVECCPASTDTGSSSGRSKQLETAWTARRTSSDHSFNNKLDKQM